MPKKYISPNRIELVNSAFHIESSAGTRFVAVLITVLMLSSIILVQLWPVSDPEALMAIWKKLSENITNKPKLIFMMVLPVLIYIGSMLVFRIGRKTRIYIDDAGMYFRTGLPDSFSWMNLDWDMAWTDIKTVDRNRVFQNNRMPIMVNIKSTNKTWRGQPAVWKNIEEVAEIKPRLFAIPIQSVDHVQELFNSHIIRHLEKHGIKFEIEPAQGDSIATFDLNTSPYTMAAMGIMALVGFYSFFDGILLDESYPEVKLVYEVIWGTIGLVAAAIMAFWLYIRKIPLGVGIGLGFLLGVILQPALYMATLRVNILTDTTAPELYEYKVEPGVKLMPIDPELPVITYFDLYDSFWDEYLSGKNIKIAVRKGGLGIYQFDVERVHELMRQYNKQIRENN